MCLCYSGVCYRVGSLLITLWHNASSLLRLGSSSSPAVQYSLQYSTRRSCRHYVTPCRGEGVGIQRIMQRPSFTTVILRLRSAVPRDAFIYHPTVVFCQVLYSVLQNTVPYPSSKNANELPNIIHNIIRFHKQVPL